MALGRAGRSGMLGAESLGALAIFFADVKEVTGPSCTAERLVNSQQPTAKKNGQLPSSRVGSRDL